MRNHKKILIPFTLILLFSLAYICFTILMPNSVQSMANTDTKIFIASDIHYLSNKLIDNKQQLRSIISNGDGKQVDYIDEIMNAFVREVKLEKPNYVIISGDITLNGEKQSHLDFSNKLKDIEASGTSVLVIPGNHDINNPIASKIVNGKAEKVEPITPKEFENIYSSFGYDEALSKDDNSLSYLYELTPSFWVLMLDSCNYTNNLNLSYPQSNGSISKKTLNWFEQCIDLAERNNSTIAVVSHHNILDHYDAFHDNFTIDNGDDVLELLNKSHVQLALTGHIHHQHIQTMESNNKSFYDIASSSFAVHPHKYGILNYSSIEGLDYSTKPLDIESFAKMQNYNDKNLLNFNNYSKSFLMETSYRYALRSLNKSNEFTKEENETIAKTVAKIRVSYLDSFSNLDFNELINSSEFQLLKSSKSTLMQYYVDLVLNERTKNNDKLHIYF